MSDIKTLELDIINAVIFDRGENHFALTNLRPDYFSTEEGRIGWETVMALSAEGKEVNVITFNETVQRRGKQVADYMQAETFGSCDSAARELITNWKIQKTGEYYREMMCQIQTGESPDTALSAYLTRIVEINNIGLDETTAFKPAVIEYTDYLAEIISGKTNHGFSWGVPSIDRMAGRIEPGRIYVIAALKKTGKSRFIVSVMDSLLKAQVPVFFISLEMTRQDMVAWLATKNTRLNFDGSGHTITSSMAQAFALKAPALAEYPLWISDMPSDISRIEGMIRRHVAAFNTRVVFLDYFQQIRKGPMRGQSMATVMDMEAARLQIIAKELKVAIVYLSQMPVEAERLKDEGKKAGIGYLKGCGGMAEAADLIMVLDNESRNKGASEHGRQIISATVWGRRCISGATVKLTADLGLLEFLPMDENHNEEWYDKM